MFDYIKTKIKTLFNSSKDKITDYSTQISNTHDIQHLFIYKNERLLRLNNIGNYLWYCCWNKSDGEASLYFLEFLQFVASSIPMRVYVVLNQVHILISFNTKDMTTIYDNYITYNTNHMVKPNIFLEYLLQDISLDIPQSYIQGKLNKAIKYHRTTLDGELDENFQEVKKQESKFPMQVQPNRYILEADNIYEIRDKISYISQPLSVFVSDQELLMFGHIMLDIDKTYIAISLTDVWETLPQLLIAERIITDHKDLDDFMMSLIDICMNNEISLIIDDKPQSSVIYPDDFNEEVIEQITIKQED